MYLQVQIKPIPTLLKGLMKILNTHFNTGAIINSGHIFFKYVSVPLYLLFSYTYKLMNSATSKLNIPSQLDEHKILKYKTFVAEYLTISRLCDSPIHCYY